MKKLEKIIFLVDPLSRAMIKLRIFNKNSYLALADSGSG